MLNQITSNLIYHHKSQLLEQEVADIRGLAVGNVSVGVFPCISRFWMPNILRDFTTRYPGITLSIRESGQDDLDEWLKNGSVDLLLYSRQPNFPYQWVQFMQDDLCAVVPEGHPLVWAKEISLEQLEGEPFIMEDDAHDHDIPRLLKESGFTPNVCWSSKDELAIINMVKAGLGVSVLPGLYLKERHPGVVILPLVPGPTVSWGPPCSAWRISPPLPSDFWKAPSRPWGSSEYRYKESTCRQRCFFVGRAAIQCQKKEI